MLIETLRLIAAFKYVSVYRNQWNFCIQLNDINTKYINDCFMYRERYFGIYISNPILKSCSIIYDNNGNMIGDMHKYNNIYQITFLVYSKNVEGLINNSKLLNEEIVNEFK